jgi:RNA polymerase sigma-70 factor (ECF subfamily)
MHSGDQAARDELLQHLCKRLQRLTRKMLKGYPKVKRWDDTSDVFQNGMLRLLRSLGEVKPATVQDLIGLTALQMRRELIDLARSYGGPHGPGTMQAGQEARDDQESPHNDQEQTTYEPSRLATWSEFHAQVDQLPENERQVFDLLWYQELTQAEAAKLLQVAERTIRQRWQTARLLLQQALKGGPPGPD